MSGRYRFRRSSPAVDLLGFLESCGFRFELRGDCVEISVPPLLRCMQHKVQEILPAIRLALEARATPATAAAASRPARQPALGQPALEHRGRGEWDSYVWVGELHPVFAGTATNEREAKMAAREKFAALSSRRK